MCIGEYDYKPSSGEFFKFVNSFPFAMVKNQKINIVDVDDVAAGVVLALEKDKVGERYILGGNNVLFYDLIKRIKKRAGKRIPTIALPLWMAYMSAYCAEVISHVLQTSKPIIPWSD